MKRVLLLVVLAILLSGCLYINDVKNKTLKVGIGVKDKVMSFKESMQAYWACMDGCLFMQKIHEEKYGLNMTKEDHDICAAMCWEQYGGGVKSYG